jgi:hypothetical protein
MITPSYFFLRLIDHEDNSSTLVCLSQGECYLPVLLSDLTFHFNTLLCSVDASANHCCIGFSLRQVSAPPISPCSFGHDCHTSKCVLVYITMIHSLRCVCDLYEVQCGSTVACGTQWRLSARVEKANIRHRCSHIPCFRSVPSPHTSLFMMKPFHIRSFHASHQLNLQPMDNEREYLPWMSDFFSNLPAQHF